MWYNSVIQWVLKSPLHPVVSQNMMLITVVGCKTGRKYTFPVNYIRTEDKLYILSSRTRKWWANLRGGVTVTLHLYGKHVLAHGRVLEDEDTIQERLRHLIKERPSLAGMVKVSPTTDGSPEGAALRAAANAWVVIELHLGVERFTEEFQRVVG